MTRDTFLSNPDAAIRALHCLLEGCSIRSTERLTGLNRNTIMRLLFTTDGLNHYRGIVPMCFGLDVDFAQLVKLFDRGQFDSPEGRYSPPNRGGYIQGSMRQSRSRTHQHVFCGAAEFDHPHGDAAFYSPD